MDEKQKRAIRSIHVGRVHRCMVIGKGGREVVLQRRL